MIVIVIHYKRLPVTKLKSGVLHCNNNTTT